jgi:hypothetical protein
MESMQTAGAQANRDRIVSKAQLSQLAPRHHPVLAPRQPRQRSVVIASPRKLGLKQVFRGLGFHALIVAGKSARVARRVWRFGGVFVAEA